jgi:hypothetical protein
VPGVLIFAYLIVKFSTTLKDIFHNSDIEDHEKEEAN